MLYSQFSLPLSKLLWSKVAGWAPGSSQERLPHDLCRRRKEQCLRLWKVQGTCMPPGPSLFQRLCLLLPWQAVQQWSLYLCHAAASTCMHEFTCSHIVTWEGRPISILSCKKRRHRSNSLIYPTATKWQNPDANSRSWVPEPTPPTISLFAWWWTVAVLWLRQANLSVIPAYDLCTASISSQRCMPTTGDGLRVCAEETGWIFTLF